MPGKNRPSKLIRRKAYEDVYSRNGEPPCPEDIAFYADAKHRELYVKVYTQVMNMYWNFESVIEDMNSIYGESNA